MLAASLDAHGRTCLKVGVICLTAAAMRLRVLCTARTRVGREPLRTEHFPAQEKRLESETGDSTYHIMERAYGSFQRAIILAGQCGCRQGGGKLQEWCVDRVLAQGGWRIRQAHKGILN